MWVWWQVEEGAFVKEHFDELCWTLTAKKNYQVDSNGNSMLSNQDAFRLWCLFNFLSEDKYPLIMVPDEVRAMATSGTLSLGARPQQNHEGGQIALALSHIPFLCHLPALAPVHTQLSPDAQHCPTAEQFHLLPGGPKPASLTVGKRAANSVYTEVSVPDALLAVSKRKHLGPQALWQPERVLC